MSSQKAKRKDVSAKIISDISCHTIIHRLFHYYSNGIKLLYILRNYLFVQ